MVKALILAILTLPGPAWAHLGAPHLHLGDVSGLGILALAIALVIGTWGGR